MGKNRKPKQVASQSSQSDSEDSGGHEVPVEFLTSDDFQVVQKKKHNKRSPDIPEDFPNFPRSRHNSCKASVSSEDAEEALGCHSGFWTNRTPSVDQLENLNHADVTANGTDALHGDEKSVLQMPHLESIGTNLHGCKKLSDSVGSDLKTCSGRNTDFKNICNVEKKESVVLFGESVTYSIGNCEAKFEVDQDKISESVINEPKNELSVTTENSSLSAEGVSEVKCQKKKKKQKLKKLETGISTDNMSSDNSPTECPCMAITDGDYKEKNAKLKKELEKQHDRKRPSKKQLAAIHEALKKAKEEEESQRREEEERKKLAEEAERLRLEKLKLEQEKKEKKKIKEKMRKEKLKAEGRLLSKSQKQARARMQATIEIYRQQGVDIPQIGEKATRPRLGSYKSTNRRRFDSSQSDKSEAIKSERHKTMSLSSQESKDSITDIPSSLESRDSLDLFSPGSLTTESDTGHFSCSEESDALDDEHDFKSVASELEASLRKVNLAKMKIEKAPSLAKTAEANKDEVTLRSPVVCVLGHVDTGKTKLLDYIRKTHVQDSEAGGITQQIGATMIPQSALKDKCKMVKDFSSFKIEVPGLLVIDTPGHESFKNLRSRGTSLCDIAILVVDIMHGLQAQTLESINLLKESKIPFVVALNKVDRIYGWESIKDSDIVHVVNSQKENTLWEFKKRCQDLILQFANECLNAALFYENKDPRSFISMVPMSAISGDGMGNILSLITQLTQSLMYKQLQFSDDLKATVLEVKVIPGLGTTVDVILVNGQLHEGDTIVLAGQDGPIVTQIRSLLMPQSLKELRVKNPYTDYKVVKGAQGVKISGKDLDKTLAGMPVFVAKSTSEVDGLKSKVSELLCQAINSIKTSERGVYVQASTLGSLEALLDYLTSSGIPYFGVKIGPVVKKDVMKASIMLEHDIQYATILAFDVKIERDAQELADHLGVKILHADIIYHLFDMFVEHRENHLKKLEEKRHLAIFPCILTLLDKVSSKGGTPINLHVTVEAGTLKEGTPLCVPKRGNFDIGNVAAIQVKGASVTSVNEGESAMITVETDHETPIELESDDNLVSRISRQSIEVLKEYYRDELCPSDWHLMSELKKVLHPV